jgi:hypothetical protein
MVPRQHVSALTGHGADPVGFDDNGMTGSLAFKVHCAELNTTILATSSKPSLMKPSFELKGV